MGQSSNVMAVAITANFSVGGGQASGVVPLTVDFVDQSTSDRPIVSRQWEFGDGGKSKERTVQHAYKTCGTYTLTLSVTDASGEVSSGITHVEVSE